MESFSEINSNSFEYNYNQILFKALDMFFAQDGYQAHIIEHYIIKEKYIGFLF